MLVQVPSVVSNCLWPYGLQDTKLFCPWNSPGKNTGMHCHALLQGIFPNQGLTCISSISCVAGGFFTDESQGKPCNLLVQHKCVWWHPDISVSSLFSSKHGSRKGPPSPTGGGFWLSVSMTLLDFLWPNQSPQPLWAINTCTCLLLSDVH